MDAHFGLTLWAAASARGPMARAGGLSTGARLGAMGALLACAGTRAMAPSLDSIPKAARGLTDLDGRPVAVQELASAKDATVLVFWAAGCPCVKRYDARLEDLHARWPGKVGVWAVSSNADDDVPTLRRVRAERGLKTPILVDEHADLAAALGARSTPAVVVVDRAGQVRFRGWIDNERQPGEEGREPYLERAVEGILAGRSDFASASPVYGCVITRDLARGPRKASVAPEPTDEGEASGPNCH
jgi:hypothetical protein